MASITDLQNDFDKLKTDVTAALNGLKTQIATLQAQLAAGTPVTQAQLDALDQAVKDFDTTVTTP